VVTRAASTPLTALLAATVIASLGWMVVTPPFQAPDENAHFGYVQTLAERGAVPESAGAPVLSTEQNAAAQAANSIQTQQQLATKPEWSERAYARWLAQERLLGDSARTDGGPNPAGVNPPLYYLWEAVPYSLGSSGDVFARLSLMRVWNIPFLLVTVAATWLLAGTVFGPRPALQIAAAAVPALFPMTGFIASSVTPDSLIYALWSLVFLFGARVILRKGGLADLVALVVTFVLALATKSISFALAPSVLLVLAVVVWRQRHRPRFVPIVAVSGALLLAVVVGAWLALVRGSDRAGSAQINHFASLDNFDPAAFASYVWQFYLPRLSFQSGYPELSEWPPQAYDFWVKKSWGAFGWLEVQWPAQVYWVLGLFGLVVGVGAAYAVWKRRARVSAVLIAFFALGVVTLLFGLHWSEFKMLRDFHLLINQGRYLFPLISLAGLAAAAALTLAPVRVRPAVLGAAVGGLAALELLSMALTATRFYA
jgi:4-amino-4-deoxy-L-arabinose transferase-like glycosyltransferase